MPNRQHWGRFLAEVVLIVLGVLLGIMANEWRAGLAGKARARHGLVTIASEIRSNRDQVDRVLPLHKVMRDSLQAVTVRMMTTGKTPDFATWKKTWTGGFSVPLLETASWETANRTGIFEDLDFSRLRTLTRYYTLLSFYQDKLDRLNENIYVAVNIDPANRQGLILALTILTNDLTIQEERLVEVSNKLLEHMPTE